MLPSFPLRAPPNLPSEKALIKLLERNFWASAAKFLFPPLIRWQAPRASHRPLSLMTRKFNDSGHIVNRHRPTTHRQLLYLLCQWHSDNIIYFIYCVELRGDYLFSSCNLFAIFSVVAVVLLLFGLDNKILLVSSFFYFIIFFGKLRCNLWNSLRRFSGSSLRLIIH